MNEPLNRTIINIVSGKGGTGKTLLVSVLADLLGNSPDTSVLVIDLDVFVRGLTSLLYFHQEEKLKLAAENEFTVSNFFVNKLTNHKIDAEQLATIKYRSFDVMPAVSRIDALLTYEDIIPDNRDQAKHILNSIFRSLPSKYRFIILDSRAGYDELIAATHELSDLSICVEDQDPISRVTSDNLIAQLKATSSTPLFRLINKARGIRSVDDLELVDRGIADLGVIPFDMDVLENFGSIHFWDEITRSLYRSAVARAWNRLSSKMQIGLELKVPRVSPIVSERLEERVGLLSWKDRIIFVYGIVIAIIGVFYGFFGRQAEYIFVDDPFRLVGLLMGLIGFTFSLYAFFRRGSK